MAVTINALVRFAHVDAAGIVFYPRYFEMLNSAVEDWFAGMGYDFRKMHLQDRIGVPTVKLTCEITAPSSLGDMLTITIRTTHVGRSSCAVDYLVSGDDGDRLKASAVLVCMDLVAQKPIAWPAELQARLFEGMQSS
jgi:4-hydroxybenzoyl-CoA thioesterase